MDISQKATVDFKGGHIIISFRYDPDLVELVKKIPGRRWNPDSRSWVVPANEINEVTRLLPHAEYTGPARELLSAEALAGLEASLPEDGPQPEGIKVDLWRFQRADAEWLKDKDFAILGHEMGVGKTIEAITWAKPQTIVVCPAVAKESVWRYEISRARPEDKIEVLYGSRPRPFDKNADWIVINYQILEKWLSSLPDPNSLIVDEAHYIRNWRKANLARATIALARRAKRVLCLSGTIVVNRPIDLFPILLCLNKISRKDYWRFVEQYTHYRLEEIYARGGKKRTVLRILGGKNLHALTRYIRPFYLRRTKKEVLKDLPPITYKNITVDLENQDEYREEEKRVITYLRNDDALNPAPWNARAISRLGAIQQLRNISAEGKLNYISEILEEHRLQGKKAVVFCCFIKPLKHLHERFPQSVFISGEDTAPTKAQKVKAFQENPECLFALCSTTAMGVAVSLTASDTCYFLDLPWTPAEWVQASARLHRIGQPGNTQVIHLLGRNTIDPTMLGILRAKAEVVDDLVGEGASRLDVLKEIEKELLGPNYQRKEEEHVF